MEQISTNGRIAAVGVAVVTAATLLLRLTLTTGETGSVPAALASMSQFFTILTNTLILITMVALAMGARIAPRVVLAITVAIICVGVIYHAVLAKLWNPQGWVLVADHGVHTIVPLLGFLWWLAFADKRALRWADALVCTVWPIIYCIYILFRASFSGVYPYPFLDVAALGMARVLGNVAGLTAGFVILGLVMLALGRLTRSRPS